MRPYATVIVGARTQYVCKVDWVDYDFILQWPWTFAVSHPRHGGLVYARRSVREGDRNVTVLMHRVIIIERMGLPRPSDKHFVDHDNGDSLDNRRINDAGRPQLAWLTNQENMAKRYGVRNVPIVQAHRSALSDIPF